MVRDLSNAGAAATLVRINPDLPLADDNDVADKVISLPLYGLDAVRIIDKKMETMQQKKT